MKRPTPAFPDLGKTSISPYQGFSVGFEPSEAKTAYQQGRQLVEKEFGSLDRYQSVKGRWFAWTYCQVLRREAEVLLQLDAAGAKP